MNKIKCEHCKVKVDKYYIIKGICEDCMFKIYIQDELPDEPIDFWY